MAKLNKSRARNPLAEGPSYNSWGKSAHMEERFSIRVASEAHSYTLYLGPNETRSFVGFVASHETFIYGLNGVYSDKRTLPEKLRAWADKLEKEANGHG
jgi:hypothetical protein